MTCPNGALGTLEELDVLDKIQRCVKDIDNGISGTQQLRALEFLVQCVACAESYASALRRHNGIKVLEQVVACSSSSTEKAAQLASRILLNCVDNATYGLQ
eukprot:9338387-Pyramimonas_sp.AAC.1